MAHLPEPFNHPSTAVFRRAATRGCLTCACGSINWHTFFKAGPYAQMRCLNCNQVTAIPYKDAPPLSTKVPTMHEVDEFGYIRPPDYQAVDRTPFPEEIAAMHAPNTDLREQLAREIRIALGPFNHVRTPVAVLVREVSEKAKKFQAFKDIVHGTLDRIGIDPCEGIDCRIRSRMAHLEVLVQALRHQQRPLPEITQPEQLQVGAYYELHYRKHPGDSCIAMCDWSDSYGAYFHSRIWATEDNPQAFQRWRIFGPVPVMTELPPEPTKPKPIPERWDCIEFTKDWGDQGNPVKKGSRYWVLDADEKFVSVVSDGPHRLTYGFGHEHSNIFDCISIGPRITDAEKAMAWCRGEHLAKALPTREERA